MLFVLSLSSVGYACRPCFTMLLLFTLAIASFVTANSPQLLRRADCSTKQVASGDSCGALATKCGISPADFTKYNPDPKLCSSLQVGQYVCCSSGTLPDMSPKQNSDGSCASYLVKDGDYCSLIASSNSLTVDDINALNNKTWGWMGCDLLQASQTICLSKGDPPMPASVENAICGPQVPGTEKPADMEDLASLNQCPLNACCNVSDQIPINCSNQSRGDPFFLFPAHKSSY